MDIFSNYNVVTITLTYKRPDGSQYTENVTTTSFGLFSSTYKPDMIGSWNVTASWPGDKEYTPATSLTIKFTMEEKTFLEKYGAWIGLGGSATVIVIVAVVLARRRKAVSPRVPPPPSPIYPRPAPTPSAPPTPTRKYCIHCGVVIPPEAVYCPHCGGKQD